MATFSGSSLTADDAKRRQIEHWRSELRNLGAERVRLQQWCLSQPESEQAPTQRRVEAMEVREHSTRDL